jgi:hypothetical protein
VRLRDAALAGASLVACEGAPAANVAADNPAVIEKAAANEAARRDGQPAETPPAPRALTGHARIDAFIAELAAGRRGAALAWISSMESVSGLPNAVATPAAFVDKLLGCSYVSVRQVAIGTTMYDITWRCPDGDYRSLIDPDWRPPRLAVGQFESAAVLDERRRDTRIPSPPPPPLPPRNPQR